MASAAGGSVGDAAVAMRHAGAPAKASKVDLEAKAAAASAALVEKMRAAAEAKATKAKEREEAKAAEAAKKAAEKEAKAAEKAAAKAAKEAEKAAEKEAKAAEKAAKKAAKEAEEAAKPKRPVGRPRKEAAAAGGAGTGSTASSVLDDLREPLPAITPAMRKRIHAAESVDLELHPALFGAEPTTVEEANAEIARLRAQLAALSEAYSHQKAVIRGSLELLSAVPH